MPQHLPTPASKNNGKPFSLKRFPTHPSSYPGGGCGGVSLRWKVQWGSPSRDLSGACWCFVSTHPAHPTPPTPQGDSIAEDEKCPSGADIRPFQGGSAELRAKGQVGPAGVLSASKFGEPWEAGQASSSPPGLVRASHRPLVNLRERQVAQIQGFPNLFNLEPTFHRIPHGLKCTN